MREFFRAIGWRCRYLAQFFGGTSLLAVAVFRQLFRRPFDRREFLRQCSQVGVKSLTIVLTTSTFVGMVLALQFAYGLARFGAKLYVAKLVGLGLVREMGPVLASVLVGGKVGAGITAELGSMNVTEQVDAIRALGANPVRKLVVPRVLACTLMLPLLAIYADIIGVFGGLFVCVTDVGMDPRYYFTTLIQVVKIHDVVHGMVKTVFFGFFIGLIGCYNGLRTTGGTEGVGASTTTTVVMVSITILVSDFFLSKLFWIF